MKRRLKDDLKASLYYIYVQIELPLRPLLGAFFCGRKNLSKQVENRASTWGDNFSGSKRCLCILGCVRFFSCQFGKVTKKFFSSNLICFFQDFVFQNLYFKLQDLFKVFINEHSHIVGSGYTSLG